MLISECAESNGTGKLSPSGEYLALSKSLTVKLYQLSDSMKFLTRWTVLDEVSLIEWSKSGTLIMCLCKKRGLVSVFSCLSFSWTCSINPGLLGIFYSCMSSDSSSVLTVDRAKSRVTIWNMSSSASVSLKPPKFGNKGFSFSPSGQSFAMLTRNLTDFVSFYSTNDWTCLSDHPLAFAAGDLVYLHDSSAVIIWSESFECTFVVLSSQGQALARFEGDSCKPGISDLALTASYIAVCSLDFKVRVFHVGSWAKYHEFCYLKSIQNGKTLLLNQNQDFKGEQVTSLDFEFIKRALNGPAETLWAVWKHDGRALASVLKCLPHLVWLWDCMDSGLAAVVVLNKSVKSVVWAGEDLVWVCGDERVFLLNQGMEVCDCSCGDIVVSKVEFKGGAFLLQNKVLAVYARFNN